MSGPTRWGRVARRGAGNINYGNDPSQDGNNPAQDLERRRLDVGGQGSGTQRSTRDDSQQTGTETGGDLNDKRASARVETDAERSGVRADRKRRKPLPARPVASVEPAKALRRLLGDKEAGRLSRRLNVAAKAFAADRFTEAHAALVPVIRKAPSLPEGRELMGLTLYRMGRWADAIGHLESFRELTGGTEQHPVLVDCHRALGHWDDVDQLWRELGEVSPSAELVSEGRVVAAGAKADRGDLQGAIAMLEKGWSPPKQPRPHHLRRAYALGDLYDRAGRAARARSLFSWVARHDPGLGDVVQRSKSLS